MVDVVSDDLKKEYPDFTEDELKAFQSKQRSYFKGTIAICVIYGAFALILLAISFISPQGKSALADDFLPFIITFAIGVTLIVITFAYSIYNMQPVQFQNNMYDRFGCPDYWKMQRVDISNEDNLPAGIDNEYKSLYSFKCVPDETVFNKTQNSSGNYLANFKPYGAAGTGATFGTGLTAAASSTVTTANVTDANLERNAYGQYLLKDGDNNYYAFTKVQTADLANATLSNLNANAPNLFTLPESTLQTTSQTLKTMRCDEVFPAAFARYDEGDGEGNDLRCAYAKKCNIRWSSACPM